MAVRGKMIQEIVPEGIFDLVTQRTLDDEFLDFKKDLFHSKLPKEEAEKQRNDFALGCTAFANAQGGHNLVGVDEEGKRATALYPMDSHEAERVATICRDISSRGSGQTFCNCRRSPTSSGKESGWF